MSRPAFKPTTYHAHGDVDPACRPSHEPSEPREQLDPRDVCRCGYSRAAHTGTRRILSHSFQLRTSR